jgi:hypothetical protein
MSYTPLKKSLVIAALLGLTACAPNMFPDGYTHHGKIYKSDIPPSSFKFTQKQRDVMGPEQADQIRLAVYSLVENLTARAGLPPKPVYIVQPEPMMALHAHLDNDLRESLRHMGYRLADTPDGAYPFTYQTETIKDANGKVLTNGSPNVRITLHVYDKGGPDARMLTQESGDFYIKGADVMDFPMAFYPEFKGPDMAPPPGEEGR